jgi:hypothetical protein
VSIDDTAMVLSGQLVFSEMATFYFDKPGNWIEEGWPVYERLHRLDGPAIIWHNGDLDWYLNGRRHREDGPARIWSDGTQEWWIEGQRHCEAGPAIIYNDGSRSWWVAGVRTK